MSLQTILKTLQKNSCPASNSSHNVSQQMNVPQFHLKTLIYSLLLQLRSSQAIRVLWTRACEFEQTNSDSSFGQYVGTTMGHSGYRCAVQKQTNRRRNRRNAQTKLHAAENVSNGWGIFHVDEHVTDAGVVLDQKRHREAQWWTRHGVPCVGLGFRHRRWLQNQAVHARRDGEFRHHPPRDGTCRILSAVQGFAAAVPDGCKSRVSRGDRRCNQPLGLHAPTSQTHRTAAELHTRWGNDDQSTHPFWAIKISFSAVRLRGGQIQMGSV